MHKAQATARCPSCGGEIHAIAGKCKHCKTDLVEFRQRAAEAARFAAMRAAPMASPDPAADGSQPHSIASGAPPPVVGRIEPMQQPPTSHQAQPHTPPGIVRRWPYLVGALAIFVIGLFVGILVGEARSDRSDDAEPALRDSKRPLFGMDRMPSSPVLPDLPDLGGPSDPIAPPSGGLSGGAPADPDQFTGQVAGVVCQKLGECGVVDDTTSSLCELFASQLSGDLGGGTCNLDAISASRCLDAIQSLPCDATKGSDVLGWLMSVESLSACSDALTCT